MTHAEAVELIRPAIHGAGRRADIGAGAGTITQALAALLSEDGAVIAVDNDSAAVRALETLSDRERDTAGASTVAAAGDLRDLEAIQPLTEHQPDGALLANALHYVHDPVPSLAGLGRLVHPGGRIVSSNTSLA